MFTKSFCQVVPLLLAAASLGATQAHATVVISQKHGFDKCAVPTVSAMKTWWNNSPYWDVNVYIGGVMRACTQSNLSSTWVTNVHAQGWNFIPTWVGPQAPCTSYSSRISWNTTTAYNEGIAQADKAITAATNLGFTSPMIIYYDMEGYPDDWACYNAVNSFMNGWGARMRARNHYAGGYGSACASGVKGWGDITNWPHSVWMAHWIYGSYNTNASVWGVACVPDSYWVNHQRIRQYAGDHNETYGGITFNIDSNVLDGKVQGSNQHALTSTGTTEELAVAAAVPPDASGDKVVLKEGTAMASVGGRTLVSTNGARTWHELSAPPNGVVQAGLFLDARRGWLATTTLPDEGGRVTLLANATSDGGNTWRTGAVHTFRLDDGNVIAGPVWLDFVDARTGWIAVRLSSSSNFSRGMLFHTQDGGQTWRSRSVPIGAEVRFVDARTGWTAGGAGGNELYVTRDGGETWTRVEVAGVGEDETAFYDSPTFTSRQDGVLPVTVAAGDRSRVEFHVTSNGGHSWSLAKSVPLAREPGTKVPVAIADGLTWIVADPSDGVTRLVGGKQASRVSGWPADIVELQFDTASSGLVQTATTTCEGTKSRASETPFRCTTSRRLLRTDDGGRTWVEAAP